MKISSYCAWHISVDTSNTNYSRVPTEFTLQHKDRLQNKRSAWAYDHRERAGHGAQARHPIVSTNHATCEPARAGCKHEGAHGMTGEREACKEMRAEMR